MSGDPLEMSEADAQTAAEHAAEEADYQRQRALLLYRARMMRPDEIARLIERAERVERERDNFRAALEEIARMPISRGPGATGYLLTAAVERARRAITPPF